MDERKRKSLEDLKKAYGLPDFSSEDRQPQKNSNKDGVKGVHGNEAPQQESSRSINDIYSRDEKEVTKVETPKPFVAPVAQKSYTNQSNNKHMFKEIIWPLLMLLGLIFLLVFGYRKIKTFVGNNSDVETMEIGDKLTAQSVVDGFDKEQLNNASDEQVDEVIETILDDDRSQEEKAEEVAEILDEKSGDNSQNEIDYSSTSKPERNKNEDASNSSQEDVTESPQEVASTQVTGDCLVVVGLFGETANANKMVKKIRNKGFSASLVPYSGKNLVGVPVGCDDYQQTLGKVQSSLEKGAWLKRL